MKSSFICFSFFLSILFFSLTVSGKGNKHDFKPGDIVPVHVNKVSPYANPSESYDYYKLPFCEPKGGAEQIGRDLGEKLEGNLPKTTPFQIKFARPQTNVHLCKKTLKPQEAWIMVHAIKQYYYYEFEIDNLPVRGFIGTVETEDMPETTTRYFLFTHYQFNFLYNEEEGKKGFGRVIHVNVTPSYEHTKEFTIPPKGQEPVPVDLEFTYSTTWEKTNVKFENRREFWHDTFFHTTRNELEIHWLSILNSFVLVILLTSFLAIIIMRILKSDYTRYEREDLDEDEEDYGWKVIHGHVFRFPPFKNLFAAFYGIGWQFLLMTFSILILALIGLYYPGNEGNLALSAIILYALTSGVAGFAATRFYTQMGGKGWAWNIILTATLYALPFFLIAFILNMIAVAYHVTNALPVGTILWIVFIWSCVGFPLTVAGGVAGRRMAGEFHAPVRTKHAKREIPPIPFYRRLGAQMVIAGFLPFSAIYIELFYIFNSVWGRSSYQLWGILFLVFLILLIVTICITVALTYFQLSMEDYRWWWHSFLSGGSTGIFIYAYAIFYYLWRSNMTGFLQVAWYFGYTAVVCYFFFIMLGTVGFYASLVFVKRIFTGLHIE